MPAAGVACAQAGFHQQQPLSDQEWQLLPVLMAGRLMQSTLVGTYTISRVSGMLWLE
jgi:Ser/Thr protein kinase RdoA (MazF antagonist)